MGSIAGTSMSEGPPGPKTTSAGAGLPPVMRLMQTAARECGDSSEKAVIATDLGPITVRPRRPAQLGGAPDVGTSSSPEVAQFTAGSLENF